MVCLVKIATRDAVIAADFHVIKATGPALEAALTAGLPTCVIKVTQIIINL